MTPRDNGRTIGDRRRAEVVGRLLDDALPADTADDRGREDEEASRGRDQWLQENRPPHYDRLL